MMSEGEDNRWPKKADPQECAKAFLRLVAPAFPYDHRHVSPLRVYPDGHDILTGGKQ
jgi:hypothetical protein